MATNQTGIAIVIKAFLPTGKTLDEQFNALSLVKQAHETGDYSPVLAAANIDEVKAEQKTRRVEDQPQESAPAGSGSGEVVAEPEPETEKETAPLTLGQTGDEEIPDFLKEDDKRTRKSKAA